jgi:hypothetical protein
MGATSGLIATLFVSVAANWVVNQCGFDGPTPSPTCGRVHGQTRAAHRLVDRGSSAASSCGMPVA